MDKLSPALLDVAGRPETVIFVGSGISTWSGLPTWRQLLEKLIARLEYLHQSPDLVKRELANNDLLQAASYGLHKLTQQQRAEFLRETCRTAEPAAIHELIMAWGNACYMTTNYDTLLEQAIRQHRPGEVFDVVTPSQDWEVASLLQARASRFVFKPHGDIGDTAKIVLTREDYSSLKNSRINVFTAYRMLLASRPVIYIGFGLRDPDFLLLKESIASDFGGSPQDHYAIMPDVTADEQDYWLRNYGIQLVSYQTAVDDNPSKRHAPLLELLQEVGSNLSATTPLPTTSPPNSGAYETEAPRTEDTLALARHARRLRTSYSADSSASLQEIIPITLVCDRNIKSPFSVLELDGRLAPEALAGFTGKCIIDGAPGAGKTFAVVQAVTDRAKTLEDTCLDSSAALSETQVPIYVSLNQYDGDIFAYLEAALPNDLSFHSLFKAGRLAIVMDAYNEIPAQHLESGRAVEDMRGLIDASGDNTVIITTRYSNDLKDLELPSVHLDAIDASYVENTLRNSGLESAYLNASMVQVFQRPLFFQQFRAGVISPGNITNVHDVYAQLLKYYSHRASSEFATAIQLEEMLSFVGYHMIESGELTLSVTDLHVHLRRTLPPQISATDLISWLLKERILIALPRRRVLFFHHSLPEYFAGHRLSHLYTSDASAPEVCFGKRRWDQALLLTLGFLGQNDAKKLMERIFTVDTRMGLRSLNYVETNRTAWTNSALAILLALDDDSDLSPTAFLREFDELLLTEESLPYLWPLVDAGDSLGGMAAAKVWTVGDLSDRAALRKHISTRFDFNYLNRFIEGITDSLSQEDALAFLTEANEIRPEPGDMHPEEDSYRPAISAVATALKRVSIETVIEVNESLERNTPVTDLIVLDRCSDDPSVHALKYIVDAVIRKLYSAEFALYLQLSYHTPDPRDLALLEDEKFVASIMSLVSEQDWVIKCIAKIVELVPGWAKRLPSDEHIKDPVTAAVWQYVRGDRNRFMEKLEDLCVSNYKWTREELEVLGDCEVDWAGNEDLLVQLIYRGDIELSVAVSKTNYHRHSSEPHLARRPIPNLLDFIERVSKLDSSRWDDRLDLLRLTAHVVDQDGQTQLKEVLSTGPIEYRRLVAHEVLFYLPGFTLDQLPPGTVDWLISDLGNDSHPFSFGNVLSTASEAIVSEKLQPLLLENMQPQARKRLLEILRAAGRRHDRRYVDNEGELLL